MRRLAPAGRVQAERVPPPLEEPRERLRAQRAKGVGEEPRDDQTVLERIAGARRRLGASLHDAPGAVGPARQIEGDVMHEDPTRRRRAMARSLEAGGREDERGRNETAGHEALLAIEVGGDGVQDNCALAQAAREALPLGRRDDQRKRVESPRARRSVGSGVDVIGDAVLVDLPRDPGLGPGELLGAQVARLAGEALPVRSERSVLVPQLVEVTGGNAVRAEESFERRASRRVCPVRRRRLGRKVRPPRHRQARRSRV